MKEETTKKSLVGLVAGFVAFAFLHVHPVAVGHLLADPAGEILGAGVEGQQVVEVAVVKVVVDALLDVEEVDQQAVLVELPSAAPYGHGPVVPVHRLVGPSLAEMQAVACRNLHCLLDLVHFMF